MASEQANFSSLGVVKQLLNQSSSVSPAALGPNNYYKPAGWAQRPGLQATSWGLSGSQLNISPVDLSNVNLPAVFSGQSAIAPGSSDSVMVGPPTWIRKSANPLSPITSVEIQLQNRDERSPACGQALAANPGASACKKYVTSKARITVPIPPQPSCRLVASQTSAAPGASVNLKLYVKGVSSAAKIMDSKNKEVNPGPLSSPSIGTPASSIFNEEVLFLSRTVIMPVSGIAGSSMQYKYSALLYPADGPVFEGCAVKVTVVYPAPPPPACVPPTSSSFVSVPNKNSITTTADPNNPKNGTIRVFGRTAMSQVFGTGANDSVGILDGPAQYAYFCMMALGAKTLDSVQPIAPGPISFTSPGNNTMCYVDTAVSPPRTACARASNFGKHPLYINQLTCQCK